MNQGYKIIECEGITEILKDMRSCNFHENHPSLSFMERFVSQEEISKLQDSPVQRESWFLSERYTGPFGDLVGKFFTLVKPIVENELKQLKNPYKKEVRWAMGVHSYSPSSSGTEGLRAHQNVDLLSVLCSDGPLHGFIDGKWVQIEIPKNYVMISYGLSSWYGCENFNGTPLIHRVPKQKDKHKFSVGAFIGPQLDEKFINIKDDSEFETVGDLYTAYFSGKLDAINVK